MAPTEIASACSAITALEARLNSQLWQSLLLGGGTSLLLSAMVSVAESSSFNVDVDAMAGLGRRDEVAAADKSGAKAGVVMPAGGDAELTETIVDSLLRRRSSAQTPMV